VALVEGTIAQHCAEGGIALVASHQPIALPGARALALADFTA
jgi:heme exporter protein A